MPASFTRPFATLFAALTLALTLAFASCAVEGVAEGDVCSSIAPCGTGLTCCYGERGSSGICSASPVCAPEGCDPITCFSTACPSDAACNAAAGYTCFRSEGNPACESEYLRCVSDDLCEGGDCVNGFCQAAAADDDDDDDDDDDATSTDDDDDATGTDDDDDATATDDDDDDDDDATSTDDDDDATSTSDDDDDATSTSDDDDDATSTSDDDDDATSTSTSDDDDDATSTSTDDDDDDDATSTSDDDDDATGTDDPCARGGTTMSPSVNVTLVNLIPDLEFTGVFNRSSGELANTLAFGNSRTLIPLETGDSVTTARHICVVESGSAPDEPTARVVELPILTAGRNYIVTLTGYYSEDDSETLRIKAWAYDLESLLPTSSALPNDPKFKLVNAALDVSVASIEATDAGPNPMATSLTPNTPQNAFITNGFTLAGQRQYVVRRATGATDPFWGPYLFNGDYTAGKRYLMFLAGSYSATPPTASREGPAIVTYEVDSATFTLHRNVPF